MPIAPQTDRGRPKLYCSTVHRVRAAELRLGYRRGGRPRLTPKPGETARQLARREERAERQSRIVDAGEVLARIEREYTDGQSFRVGEDDLLHWLLARGWKITPPRGE
jgi:hypothetical protein